MRPNTRPGRRCSQPPGGLDALQQMTDDGGLLTRSMPGTESAADPVEPRTASRRRSNAQAAWPLRRRVVVAVLAPVEFLLIGAASGGWAIGTSPGWTALVALIAVACATTLATYVPLPGTGLRLDLGCSPCAAVAGVSVLVSFGVLGSAPHEVPTAILALGVAVFGLRQRLTNPSSCAV